MKTMTIFPGMQLPAPKPSTTVINFIGGPGAGKSTHAASAFAKMKKMGYNCELVTEYAKDCTWRETHSILKNQIYVFAKQHDRLFRLQNKVDYILTDSPLLLSLYYGGSTNTELTKLILSEFHKYNNVTFYVNRNKEYNPIGRNQNESESDEIAKQLLYILESNKIPYTIINSDSDTDFLISRILKYGVVKND